MGRENGVGELTKKTGQIQAVVEAKSCAESKDWRRGSESNRRIKVLQTSPLPLGYRAPAPYVSVPAGKSPSAGNGRVGTKKLEAGDEPQPRRRQVMSSSSPTDVASFARSQHTSQQRPATTPRTAIYGTATCNGDE